MIVRHTLYTLRDTVAMAAGLSAGLWAAPVIRPYTSWLVRALESALDTRWQGGQGVDIPYVLGFALVAWVGFRIVRQLAGRLVLLLEGTIDDGFGVLLQRILAMGVVPHPDPRSTASLREDCRTGESAFSVKEREGERVLAFSVPSPACLYAGIGRQSGNPLSN